MTVSALCEAAITESDNLAANLLVKQLGGLAALNHYAQSIGNKTFRLDNYEPNLSTVPGSIQDTSTPADMEGTLQNLVLGRSLPDKQRKQLTKWLQSNKTGETRIRAGVPKGWVVADKTGTGEYGTSNDIAVIWPPRCAPLVIAIYYTQNQIDAPQREDIIVEATRRVIAEFKAANSCLG